jgi:hypothetical protein
MAALASMTTCSTKWSLTMARGPTIGMEALSRTAKPSRAKKISE